MRVRGHAQRPDFVLDREEETFRHQNHAVRTEKWRYIRYADGGEELYDEVADPLEWKNLAGREDLAAVKAELSRHFPTTNKLPPSAGEKKARPARKKARLEKAKPSAGTD